MIVVGNKFTPTMVYKQLLWKKKVSSNITFIKVTISLTNIKYSFCHILIVR